MKIVHLIDQITGAHAGDYEADESPVEAGVFITPIFSTDLPLPIVGAKEIALFLTPAGLAPTNEAEIMSCSWVVKPNHLGEVWFGATGTPTTITEIGMPALGLTAELPLEFVLANARTKQKEILHKAYDNAIQTPVSYMGAIFQADARSRSLMAEHIAAGSVPTGFFWQDIANVELPMSFVELQGLIGAIANQTHIAFTKLQALKKRLNDPAITTEAEIMVINW